MKLEEKVKERERLRINNDPWTPPAIPFVVTLNAEIQK